MLLELVCFRLGSVITEFQIVGFYVLGQLLSILQLQKDILNKSSLHYIYVMLNKFSLCFKVTRKLDFSWNKYAEGNFEFYDQRVVDLIQSKDKHHHDFFKLLALCHTVMPEEKDGTK